MANVSSVSYNFGSDAEGRTPYIPTKERRISSKSICRYYMAGHCRRGSACRFVHPQPESALQEYAYANGHEVHTKTPHKGWDQDVGHSHGYTAYAVYTEAPHAAPHGFNASRNAFDNSSDLSSSNDSASSDHNLNTAFKVMTLKEPVSSERFPSAFSQSLPRIQYSSNTGTRSGTVTHPGNNQGHTLLGSNARAAARRKAEQAREKTVLYKTKPCKFFSARKNCAQGDKCTFIHDVEKCKRAKQAENQARGTAPSHLPPKPRSLLEELKARDYHPITWRVIGGGVMMGLPCKAFSAGYCPDGTGCRLAHETELEISPSGVVQLKTQTSEASLAVPPPGKPSLDSSTESQRRTVSIDCSGPSRASHDTDGGTSGSTKDAEKFMSVPNDTVSSKHRRTRSMSMPTSPSVVEVRHVFAEL